MLKERTLTLSIECHHLVAAKLLLILRDEATIISSVKQRHGDAQGERQTDTD